MQVSLDAFLGNADIKAALEAAFSHNRLSHAIILQGEEGLGKRTLARLLARAAVCTGEQKPCGDCPACVRFLAGSHPDVRVQEGTGVSGNIGVDAIARITADAYKKPEEANVNVYLLFVKARLPEISQNKLLKLLEEPPGSALFLITVPSAETLLPTIRSRAQVLTLRPVGIEEAAQFFMKKEGASAGAALQLARDCGGNIGKMLGGSGNAATIAQQVAAVLDGRDADALLAATAPLSKDRNLFADCVCHLRDILRDALLCTQGVNQFSSISQVQAQRLATSCSSKSLLCLIALCTKHQGLAGRNLNMSLLVTTFCAKIRETLTK